MRHFAHVKGHHLCKSKAMSYRVIAACRDPSSAQDLNTLKDKSEGRLRTVQMDITDEQSIKVIDLQLILYSWNGL